MSNPANPQSKNAILFSGIGLVSPLVGFFTLEVLQLSVHSNEIIMWLLIGLVAFIGVPLTMLSKSVTVLQKMSREKTTVRLVSIVTTLVLAAALLVMLLALIWNPF